MECLKPELYQGLDLEFIVARKEVIRKIEVLAINIYSCPPTPFQYAALKAFKMGIKWFNKVGDEYRKRRDIVLKSYLSYQALRLLSLVEHSTFFPTLKSLLEYSAIRMLMNYRELCYLKQVYQYYLVLRFHSTVEKGI